MPVEYRVMWQREGRDTSYRIYQSKSGRAIHSSDVRRALKAAAKRAGLTRRVNPHNLRHTLAVDLYREGVRELVIQKQLGHARLDVTQTYLRGLDPREMLDPVIGRRPPTMPVPNLMQTLAQTQRTVPAGGALQLPAAGETVNA